MPHFFTFRLCCGFEDVDVRTPLLLRECGMPLRASKNSQLNLNNGERRRYRDEFVDLEALRETGRDVGWLQ
jgi:hypothetical protein